MNRQLITIPVSSNLSLEELLEVFQLAAESVAKAIGPIEIDEQDIIVEKVLSKEEIRAHDQAMLDKMAAEFESRQHKLFGGE